MGKTITRNELRSLGLLTLFLFAISYPAMIAAVFLHEVAGHGLVTALLGGDFNGFGVLVDGMGWAKVDVSMLSASGQALMLAAGASVTSIALLLMVAFAIRFRRNFFASTALLVFALVFLGDGAPYFFWDAIYRGGIGDASGILTLYPDPLLRILMIVGSGLVLAIGIVAFNVLLMQRIEEHMLPSDSSRIARIIPAIILFALQAVAWLAFDWTQLIPVPEIQFLPSLTALILTVLVLVVCVFMKKQTTAASAPLRFGLPVSLACAAAVATAVCVVVFLQNGVMF